MDVALLLVPYDLGHANVGEGAGPDRLLDAGAREILVDAGHRVRRVERIRLARDTGTEVGNSFRLASGLSRRVRRARSKGEVPFVLGGNCSTSLGVMAGLAPEGSMGLVWFDAHGDANTPETSESGYFDGMPLAVVVGWCWAAMAANVPDFVPVREERVVHVGGREFDPRERSALAASRIEVVDAPTLRGPGGPARLAAALLRVARRSSGIDLHVDLDVIDARDGVANRFAARGGPSLETIEAAIERTGAACPVRAATLCSYNPEVDRAGRARRAALRMGRARARTLDP